MADTGVKYPATVSTIQETGDDNDWTTPANVGADDGAYGQITAASFDANDLSYLLRATNPSMGVPSGATIDGILVEIERHYAAGTVADEDVCLTKDGSTRVGADKSTGAAFPATDAITSFGGATDLWGTTWTVAEINATTFGVLYKMKATGANADGFVDFIRITVYYTAGAQTSYQSIGGASMTITGALSRPATFYRSMGQGAMSITGILAKGMFKVVGGATMTIASTLSAVKIVAKAVGDATMAIAGSLSRVFTATRTVGNASMAIVGTLTRASTFYRAVGQASISIAGSLVTEFIAGVTTFYQAVGDAVMAISSSLEMTYTGLQRHSYNAIKVILETIHKITHHTQ